MAFTNEQHRERYAQDEEHRKQKLADNRAWRTAHRDALNAAWSEKWRTDAAFRERKAAARRLSKYGLDAQTYERMLAEQNGVCAYCHKPARRLVVDHCHVTGVVRALLCDRCNMGSGHFGDEPEPMRRAADNIERSRGVREANLRIVARIPTAAFKLAFGNITGKECESANMSASVDMRRSKGRRRDNPRSNARGRRKRLRTRSL
jgi:recombination endonuclease VII